MKNLNRLLLIVFILILLLVGVYIGINMDVAVITNEDSFQEFAYTIKNDSLPPIMPPPPWEVETIIPNQPNIFYNFSEVRVVMTRFYNNQSEIWLKKSDKFLVYYPKLQIWKEVSNQIHNSSFYIEKIFVDTTGTIWGSTNLNSVPDSVQAVPLLSRFNESTQLFEFIENGFNLSRNSNSNEFSHIALLIDQKDIFWVFVFNDGIYRYEPPKYTIDRQATLPEFDYLDVALAPSGTLYFRNALFPKSKEESFVFRFNPLTKEITSIEVPLEPWAFSMGIFVDQQEHIWLGSMGYIDQQGNQHIIDPNPEETQKPFGTAFPSPPRIMMESSNGILWYRRYSDSGLQDEGIAWYNPETDEGEMVTNIPSLIIEDSQKQLWMVIGDKLYRYTIQEKQ